MIEDQKQLEYSIQILGRMLAIRDRDAAETAWDAGTREDVVESTDAMIRKVEREIAEFLAKKYELVGSSREKAA
jgi:hypothetical protein